MTDQHWIQTYTGGKFYYDDPENSDIRIEDIAHALSNICRYNGHTEVFYSVASHSIYCSFMISPRLAFPALMHDAAEAYIGDIPTPLKAYLGNGRLAALEERTQRAVERKFGYLVSYEDHEKIKEVDTHALFTEKKHLLAHDVDWGWEFPPFVVDPMQVKGVDSAGEAERLFLSRFNFLRKRHECRQRKTPRASS